MYFVGLFITVNSVETNEDNIKNEALPGINEKIRGLIFFNHIIGNP